MASKPILGAQIIGKGGVQSVPKRVSNCTMPDLPSSRVVIAHFHIGRIADIHVIIDDRHHL